MSRAVDLLLLLLVGLVAWLLLRPDASVAASTAKAQPIEATVRVAGEASLDGLGLLLMPADGLQAQEGLTEAAAPRQLTPFRPDRTTTIRVPIAGRYRVSFGVQDQGPPPRRARDVTEQLTPGAAAESQVLEINDASIVDVLQVQLDAAHADRLRALGRD